MGSRTPEAGKPIFYGFGPTLDEIFTRSNSGIITKLGIWLMPAPESHRTVLAVWPEEADIVKLTGTIRGLRMDGTIPTKGVMGNATIFLAATRRRAEVYDGEGAIPTALSVREAKTAGLGAWNYIFTLYGRADRVAADHAEAKRGQRNGPPGGIDSADRRVATHRGSCRGSRRDHAGRVNPLPSTDPMAGDLAVRRKQEASRSSSAVGPVGERYAAINDGACCDAQ